MLPNVLRTDAADHVPVLADEVRGLLDVQPGETVVDATFGAGGHSRLLAADLQGSGKLDRDRPRPDRPAVLRPRQGDAARRAGAGSCGATTPSSSRSSRATASRRTSSSSTSGLSSMQVDRPERGFSYATDAPLDMRMDSSDELERGGDREHVGRARARDDLPPLRRGALRAPDRPRDRRGGAGSADRAHGTARRRRPGLDPRARSLRRGASRQARLPGAPDRGQPRAGVARGGASRGVRDAPARAAGSRSSASTPSRTGS